MANICPICFSEISDFTDDPLVFTAETREILIDRSWETIARTNSDIQTWWLSIPEHLEWDIVAFMIYSVRQGIYNYPYAIRLGRFPSYQPEHDEYRWSDIGKPRFTRIKHWIHIKEIQERINELEEDVGLSITTFTLCNHRLTGIHIREIRTAIERLITFNASNKEHYFNFDTEGNDMRPGNHQLDWSEEIIDDLTVVKTPNIEELRHPINLHKTLWHRENDEYHPLTVAQAPGDRVEFVNNWVPSGPENTYQFASANGEGSYTEVGFSKSNSYFYWYSICHAAPGGWAGNVFEDDTTIYVVPLIIYGLQLKPINKLTKIKNKGSIVVSGIGEGQHQVYFGIRFRGWRNIGYYESHLITIYYTPEGILGTTLWNIFSEDTTTRYLYPDIISAFPTANDYQWELLDFYIPMDVNASNGGTHSVFVSCDYIDISN